MPPAVATAKTAFEKKRFDLRDGKIYEDLVCAFQAKGELSEAVSHYRRAIELGTPNPMIRHALAALNVEDAGPIPAEVVTNLFDDYASQFDTHLVGALGYSAPKLMREAVGRLDIVAEIDAVDLSPKMLEHARRKQSYSRIAKRS